MKGEGSLIDPFHRKKKTLKKPTLLRVNVTYKFN